MSLNIAIIGGGASGLIAAVSAARTGARVTVFERLPRMGKKLLATGNGRCNLSNARASADNLWAYHGADIEFAVPALNRFSPCDTVAFFEGLGVLCRVEAQGRMYPACGQASAVLDALRFECERLGVRVLTDTEVTGIQAAEPGQESDAPRFLLQMADSRPDTEVFPYADRVIIASGGKSAKEHGSNGSGFVLLEDLGHKITLLSPALAPIKTQTDFVRQLRGVRVCAVVTLVNNGKNAEIRHGEILFTEYGVSGIPAMQLSRYVSKIGCVLVLDLLPDFALERLLSSAAELLSHAGDESASRLLAGFLGRRLAEAVLKRFGHSPETPAKDIDIPAFFRLAKALPLEVTGTAGFGASQVTAGGADTSQFNPQTMESRLCKGLYACGEVLDIDGDCGGYNLQWAWSSGRLAAQSAADSVDSYIFTTAKI
ncbi:MAG: NAD(P)/FAD-dependent oxidoreductase [Oscillospiraceae bacterium]|jgi:predicted Rossmann fold flavoprotein|nr:NAD(P)/FAD-dependent oxidoreductase [Oscillospiraceae bacterium]